MVRSGQAGDGQPGVVVDDVEDFRAAAVERGASGWRRLASVGWAGSASKRFQDDRGRLWGWGVTKPRRVQNPPDCRDGRNIGDAGVGGKVGGDGVGAGVEASSGQGLAQHDDAVFDFDGGGLRAVVWAS